MAHDTYRVYGLSNQGPRDISSLECILEQEPPSSALVDGGARKDSLIAAMTTAQFLHSCQVMRSELGLNPAAKGKPGQVAIVGDRPVVPVADEPEVDTGSEIDDEWRVAVRVNVGKHLADYLAAMRAKESPADVAA